MYTIRIADALTIGLFFNPNVLEFWQVILGMHKGGVWEDPLHPAYLPQGRLDKLAIPDNFEGGTFGELFRLLLSSYGTIAIALYRCVRVFCLCIF